MSIRFEDEAPQAKSKIKFEEPAKEPSAAQKAYATGYGAVSGLVGGPGELESFGAYTVPQVLGVGGQPQKFAGRETVFPTMEEVSRGMSAVGIPQPAPGTSGYQTAGEIIGGFGTAIPGLIRGGKALITSGPFERITGRALQKVRGELGKEAQRAEAAGQQQIARTEAGSQAAERAGLKASEETKRALGVLPGVRTIEEAGRFRPVPETPTQVGQFIRDQAENFVNNIKSRRSELSAKNFKDTLDDAKKLEASNVFVQNTQKFGDLVKYLDDRLSVVTDPTMRSQLETIKTALTKGAPVKLSEGERRVMALRQGVSLDEIPEQTFLQPTFEGVEIMRRRIGDAAFGVPEEGYKAIGQGMAKEIYGKLSDAMKEYSKPFSKYLEDYKRLSQPIEVYGTKVGKGITETVDTGGRYYAKPSEAIAKDVFSSPQKVKELIDAVGGNKQIVEAAARRYFAGILEGKTTVKDVEKVFKDNRAVLAELPSVRRELTERYMRKIGRAEAIAKQAEKAVIPGKEFQKIRSTYSDALTSLQNANPKKILETFDNTVLPKIREVETSIGRPVLRPDQLQALRNQVYQAQQIADKTTRDRWIAGAISTYLVGQSATSAVGKLGGQ